ncbi:hypothetical protein LC040_02340 [Bacillus tianshenii]|nr:hypothetical protein LC040_02340 [Bacillus tianshenii]
MQPLLYINDIKLKSNQHTLVITYLNTLEPLYCRYFLIELDPSNFTVKNVSVYNFRFSRYESVIGLYSPALIEQIKHTVVSQLGLNEAPLSTEEVS